MVPSTTPPHLITVTQSMDPPKKVIVCGGGVIGVCTAYFLSKRGATVTLIEQSSIACAASGKAGGFLALDWCDNTPLSSLARTSFNLHRSLSQELNGQDLYGYRPVTTLSLTLKETENKKPNPNPKVPTWVDGMTSGVKTIGTNSTTAQLHPGLFTKALLEKANGVSVVIGKVERVETVGGVVKGVILEDGKVFECEKVVFALGPWTGKVGMLGELFRVYGIKAHSVVLEPKERGVVTADCLFLSYCGMGGGEVLDPEVYPRPTGEVYICGMSAEAEVPDNPEQVEPVPESIAVLKTVARNVSSYLVEGEATVKAEQACFLPSTDDNMPIIGEVPGIKGCYVATGHSCWGILNGPATGAAMSELVLDGSASIVDLTPFSPARFVRGKNSEP